MHELSTMVRLANQAIKVAEENEADRVEKIVVEVGEMTDIVPEYLQKYYPEATRGTILEGSTLETHVVETRVRCVDCGEEFHPSREYDYRCPKCKSMRAKVLKGRSVTLVQVIVETE